MTSIIRDNIYLLNEDYTKATDYNLLELFVLCFRVLSLFCVGNNTNQILLSENISVFL